MEHFLPLAVASMVISLLSIILLDHFGPSASKKIEKKSIENQKELKEELDKGIDKFQRDIEMSEEQNKFSKTLDNTISQIAILLTRCKRMSKYTFSK